MHLKNRLKLILRKEYPGEKAWKAFIFWWLDANGYDYDVRQKSVGFVDGANDGGIDAIAWPLDIQSRREILVIQSKYFGLPPTPKDLSRFLAAIGAINGTIREFDDWLATCRDELHSVYRRLREERRRLRYILITPSQFQNHQKRALNRKRVEVFDRDILTNLEQNFLQGRTPRLDELRIPGASSPKLAAEADGTRVWIFTVFARDLGQAFVRHRNMLFAGNIRYALRGQTAKRVRSGMLDTLQNNPSEFVFSHNGITVTGNGIRKRGKMVEMRSATIVNGAQTVSYFGHPGVMKHLTRNSSRVIVKFVEVNDAERLNDIESKVAFRSNNQNKVDPSDLMIELPSLVSLQRYFRRQGVHLERKKGEQKLRFGELGISKERLAQVLAAAASPQGAAKAKRKQELFEDTAHGLFADYDDSDQARSEAVAWARIDHVFRTTINDYSSRRRKKRAQQAELAALTVFNRVMAETKIKATVLRLVPRWEVERGSLEPFLERACKAAIGALLRCSGKDKRNEPAFYKAVTALEPAIDTAVWRSRRRIRGYFHDFVAS